MEKYIAHGIKGSAFGIFMLVGYAVFNDFVPSPNQIFRFIVFGFVVGLFVLYMNMK